MATAASPSGNPLDHIIQHPLITRPAHLGPLTPNGHITLLSNHIVMMITTAVLLMIVLPLFVRKRRADPGADEVESLVVPAGGGNFLEVVCEFLRKEVAEPTLHEYTDRFIKYIWTLFFFVLANNLLGLIPIASLKPVTGVHLGGTATGNIWVTGTLAVMTFLMMVVNGLRIAGWHYFEHFCPGPLWLAPLLVPIEIVGQVAKAFALAHPSVRQHAGRAHDAFCRAGWLHPHGGHCQGRGRRPCCGGLVLGSRRLDPALPCWSFSSPSCRRSSSPS